MRPRPVPGVQPEHRQGHGKDISTTCNSDRWCPAGASRTVEIMFTPRTGEELLVACFRTCVEAAGEDPGYYTFAAITDEPSAEVAAAGHDGCIAPIKPECLDAWLSPDPGDLALLYAILDDRPRPYYEHRLAT